MSREPEMTELDHALRYLEDARDSFNIHLDTIENGSFKSGMRAATEDNFNNLLAYLAGMQTAQNIMRAIEND